MSFQDIEHRMYNLPNKEFSAGRPVKDGTGAYFRNASANANAEMLGARGQYKHREGPPTWAEVSRASFYAALKEGDPSTLRQRLTEHAAIICLWLKEIEKHDP